MENEGMDELNAWELSDRKKHCCIAGALGCGRGFRRRAVGVTTAALQVRWGVGAVFDDGPSSLPPVCCVAQPPSCAGPPTGRYHCCIAGALGCGHGFRRRAVVVTPCLGRLHWATIVAYWRALAAYAAVPQNYPLGLLGVGLLSRLGPLGLGLLG